MSLTEDILASYREEDRLRARVASLEAENAQLKRDFAWLHEKEGKAGSIAVNLENENKELKSIIREIIDTSDIYHEDEDCPEDDTCECRLIARINKAMAGYRE